MSQMASLIKLMLPLQLGYPWAAAEGAFSKVAQTNTRIEARRRREQGVDFAIGLLRGKGIRSPRTLVTCSCPTLSVARTVHVRLVGVQRVMRRAGVGGDNGEGVTLLPSGARWKSTEWQSAFSIGVDRGIFLATKICTLSSKPCFN